jgi:DNA-binding transcriptional ArsR family regulator
MILKRMLEQSHALDRAFHALSDATRRALLDRLTRGPASVSELARPFEKVGRTRTCRISKDAVARVERWLSARRQMWESRFDRLGTLLEGAEARPTRAKTKTTKKFRRSAP